MKKFILHFDGDSFFASVEQALNFRLKGRVVITGGERGAITSVSVEGKKKGINRGMSLKQARVICPDLVVVSSDYTSYSIFARRMYSIVRKFTPLVEEYSIDECFADITDFPTFSHAEIGMKIKKELESSLGITFGVGLAPNKVLAKLASKYQKPAGFTLVTPENLEGYLKQTPIGKIWGIGSSTSIYLRSLGVETAFDFSQKDLHWLSQNKISRPHREIWQEIQGDFIKTLSVEKADLPGSIIRSRTFSPPSNNPDFIFSQLSSNIEEVCRRARLQRVRARHLRFYLKTQDFSYSSYEIRLPLAISTPGEIIDLVKRNFDQVFIRNILFRATGVSLSGILSEEATSCDLFGEVKKLEKSSELFRVVDKMSQKYGDHTLFLGSSFKALHTPLRGKFKNNLQLPRDRFILKGDRRKKTLNIPFLGKVRGRFASLT